MADARSEPILIAGAGVAGLTAALAFARRGFPVRIFERAARLEEAGAGIQLSPNATRLLERLGVLDRLRPASVPPEAVVLRDAGSLRELARVPLGSGAEARWGAPYLTIHRADLQQALLEAVVEHGEIELATGAEATGFGFDAGAPTLVVRSADGSRMEARGRLLVGADGVWSSIRNVAGMGASRFTGQIAWRALIDGSAAEDAIPLNAVSAFLHPKAHLVAYPLRGGAAVNLAAFTPAQETADIPVDPAPLFAALRAAAPRLKALVERAGPWSAWPLHVARARRWTDARGLALIGDAAHAMTPFAAQGAAMAIEDAVVLAELVAVAPDDLAGALARYEAARRPRVARVARRGALNQLAWHARGPVAAARNAVLKMRPSQGLAADMDWLYGADVEESLSASGDMPRPLSD